MATLTGNAGGTGLLSNVRAEGVQATEAVGRVESVELALGGRAAHLVAHILAGLHAEADQLAQLAAPGDVAY